MPKKYSLSHLRLLASQLDQIRAARKQLPVNNYRRLKKVLNEKGADGVNGYVSEIINSTPKTR